MVTSSARMGLGLRVGPLLPLVLPPLELARLLHDGVEQVNLGTLLVVSHLSFFFGLEGRRSSLD